MIKTERDVGVQHLREHTAYEEIRKRTAAQVRRPCLYDKHPFEPLEIGRASCRERV